MTSNAGQLSPTVVLDIVRAGIRAPSADNRQPWRVFYRPGRLSIAHDPSLGLLGDTRSRGSLVAIGCMVENLALGAGAVGCRAQAHYLPDADPDGVVVHLELHPARVGADPLSTEISRRITHRGTYSTRPLTAQERRIFGEAVASVPGIRLDVLDGWARKSRCARLVMAADHCRYRQRMLHEELMSSIRWSGAQNTGDGMPLKSLSLGWPAESLFKIIRPWRVAAALHPLGLARLMSMHSYVRVMQSSAILVLQSEHEGPMQLVLLGRALQRLWLAITKLGLRAQPLSLGTLLFLDLPARPARILVRLRQQLGRQLQQSESSHTAPIMLLRVGETTTVPTPSPRRPVEDVLTILQ